MTKCIARALALAALLAAAACAQAQDDRYRALRAYDGQNRKAQLAIQKAIQAAGQDKAALASIETGLIGVVDDKSATVAGKQDACRFLWIVGTRRSVPSLAKLLTDKETSNLAVYALTRNADPSAGAALRSALAKASGAVKLGIVNALGNRADAESVPPLRKLAVGSDADASECAVAALGKIGTPAAVAALKALPADSAPAGSAIVRAADRLAAAGTRAEAEALYLSIANSKRPAVPRAAALLGLAKLQSVAGARVAASCLSAPDDYVAVVAARICVFSKDVHARITAINRFPTFRAPVKIALLSAWADRSEDASGMVGAALKVQDAAVRLAAIRAAGRTMGHRAVEPLVTLAAQGDGAEREAAMRTLAAMQVDDADEDLFNLAKSGTPEIRATVMSVLARRPTPATRKDLMEAASGQDADTAQAALRALAQVSAAADYPALVKILVAATDDGVRDGAREAVVATSRLVADEAEASAPILEALNSASMQGRAAAMPALAEIGGRSALAALKKAAGSDNADVKQAAIGALAETCSDTKALPILMDIARADGAKSTRVQALRGYIRLAGSADRVNPNERLGWIKAALDAAERPEEKRQAIGALRQCRTGAAVELAATYLDNADLFDDASGTILALASRQDNRRGVQGPAVDAALDKIIATTKDDKQRDDAKKLRGQ